MSEQEDPGPPPPHDGVTSAESNDATSVPSEAEEGKRAAGGCPPTTAVPTSSGNPIQSESVGRERIREENRVSDNTEEAGGCPTAGTTVSVLSDLVHQSESGVTGEEVSAAAERVCKEVRAAARGTAVLTSPKSVGERICEENRVSDNTEAAVQH
eukprot:TRINITY_DN49608_c0_g1_i1.p2 TRINITY_DN49608_c0_g1~~TRINITY_DN49608_c0_g1_i1.p2  ORF type:complete len:155 (+),score=22.66 TRINITY_DN49608_c0_g1_i1:95-559(+)